MKRFFTTISVSLALCFLATTTQAAKIESTEERYKKIREIVLNYLKTGEDLSDEDVKSAIYKDVSKFGPLQPEKKAKKKTNRELQDEAKKLVDEKLGSSTSSINAESMKEANEKYKLMELQSPVKVIYQRGDKRITVEGIYYEHRGKSIRIDEKNVAIVDMLPEYRIKFDKDFCEREKQKFIEQRQKSFSSERIEYSTQINQQLKDAQRNYNEGLGYLYLWKQWRSAKNVTDIVIQAHIENIKLEEKTDVNKLLQDAKKKKEIKVAEKETSPVEVLKMENRPESTPAAPSIETDLDKARKKADDMLQQIGQTYAGIDADQGYKSALWGMTRQEVSLLLDGAIPAESSQNSSEISFESGPVQKIEFSFLSNIFYRVTITFRILPAEAMSELALRLQDSYGRTDEEKALEQAEIARQAEAEKAGKKAEAKPADPKANEVSETQTYHWSGEVTRGTVFIKLNKQKNGYEKFTFTKEGIRVQDEVKANIEREQRLKEEEEKKRKLQEFNKDMKKIEF